MRQLSSETRSIYSSRSGNMHPTYSYSDTIRKLQKSKSAESFQVFRSHVFRASSQTSGKARNYGIITNGNIGSCLTFPWFLELFYTIRHSIFISYISYGAYPSDSDSYSFIHSFRWGDQYIPQKKYENLRKDTDHNRFHIALPLDTMNLKCRKNMRYRTRDPHFPPLSSDTREGILSFDCYDTHPL